MLRYDRQTKPGLVALYDIRTGNGAGPFLQPRSPHGASHTTMQDASDIVRCYPDAQLLLNVSQFCTDSFQLCCLWLQLASYVCQHRQHSLPSTYALFYTLTMYTLTMHILMMHILGEQIHWKCIRSVTAVTATRRAPDRLHTSAVELRFFFSTCISAIGQIILCILIPELDSHHPQKSVIRSQCQKLLFRIFHPNQFTSWLHIHRRRY